MYGLLSNFDLPLAVRNVRNESQLDDKGRTISTRTNHVPVPLPEWGITLMPEWVQATLTAGNVLILIFAFFGNIAAIVIVARAKISRNSTKCFLITLAISDLMLAASSVTVDLGSVTSKYHQWVFGEFICEIVSFVQIQAVMMNAFCLFSIALERYLSVIRSLKAPVLSPKWRSRLPYIALGCIWIIPSGTSVPQLFAFDHWSYWTFVEVNGTIVWDNETYYYACLQKDTYFYNSVFYCTIGFIFFALLIGFLFCYLSIIHFVTTHGNNFRRNHPDESSSGTERPSHGVTSGISSAVASAGGLSPTQHKNRHRRTIRLVMSLILIFFLCRTPLWFFVIVSNTKQLPITEFNLSAMYTLHLVSNVATALSPFVYAIWNDALRATSGATTSGTKRTGCCWKSKGTSVFKSDSKGVFFIRHVKGNKYDLSAQSRAAVPSNATQKYFMSDKGEFVNRKSLNLQ